MRFLDEVAYQFHKRIAFPLVWKPFYFNVRKRLLPTAEPSKSILLIRTDAIGDFIVWLDQAKEYRKHYPEHHIVLLHNKSTSSIADQLPYIDECIPLDTTKINSLKYCKSVLRQINRYHYDKVFYSAYTRIFTTGDWFAHNTLANEKIAFLSKLSAYGWLNKYLPHTDVKSIIDGWYTTLVQPSASPLMELERNGEFSRHLWGDSVKLSLPHIPFEIHNAFLDKDSSYVVMVLGAGVSSRQWPIENFVEVAKQLTDEKIVLCGAPNEIPLGEAFLQHHTHNVINLIGKTTIPETISIIANARLLIGNETSTSHIAVATNTSSVCILGGGHFGRFMPYPEYLTNHAGCRCICITASDHSCFGCDWHCSKPMEDGKWRCIANIETHKVIAAAKEILYS